MKSLTGFRSILQNKIKGYHKLAVLGFLLPGLSGVILFVFLPFFDVVRRSFMTVATDKSAGLSNYKIVLSNQAFRLASANTFRFVFVCIPLLVGISLWIAYGLSRCRYMELLKSAYLLPLAIPTAAVVLVWKLLFHKQGMLNACIVVLGGTGLDFMGTSLSFWVLVISYLWKNLGYTVVLWLAGIFAIPEGIVEAARVDGAGERAIFFRIILPNLKPTLYTITVLSFLNSFKVFREAYLVAGSYPQEDMYLLQHLFNNWFLNLDMDKMAAGAVLTGMVLFVFIFLLQIFWDRKEEWT